MGISILAWLSSLDPYWPSAPSRANIISDNCLPFFVLYLYFLSSSTINCVNLRSDPEFKLIFTDAVLDFESITQHPDNKNII